MPQYSVRLQVDGQEWSRRTGSSRTKDVDFSVVQYDGRIISGFGRLNQQERSRTFTFVIT